MSIGPPATGNKIHCDYCNEGILSKSDLTVVAQFFPHFPFAKYHNACYAGFLKSGKFWIGPRGQTILSGPKARRGTIILMVFFLFWIGLLVFVIRPSMPHNIVLTNIIYYFLIGMGILSIVVYLAVRAYVKRLEQRIG